MQALVPQCEDVGIRLEEDTKVSVEGVHAPDRLWLFPIEGVMLSIFAYTWHGKERDEGFTHSDRPGPRTATTVRGGHRLVQVEVEDVSSHVSRASVSEEGVQVRSIEIAEPSSSMDHRRDLYYILLEDPQCVGHGEHHSRNSIIKLTAEDIEIDKSIRAGGNLGNGEAGRCGRSRVRPMRRIRQEDACSLRLTARLKVALQQEHSSDLSMGARRRL